MEEKSSIVFKYTTGEDYSSYTSVDSIEIKVDAGATVDQMMQAFKSFMLSIGYHKDNLDEYIEDE